MTIKNRNGKELSYKNGSMYCVAILISMMFVLGAFAVFPVQAAGPTAVNLGTSGDFVILTKTGISTTGTTDITGDIGVSPAAASYITGFDLIMDSSNEFSTSSLITGKVYASDYSPPTPTKMTTAVSDMETAFTDAAGRTNPDHTELGAGDITGMTLSPGLYKWGTGLLISDGGVTISGTENDVWIFQIAQDLTVANGAIITLAGGANANNIFWQVEGSVTIGTTADMKGVILSQNRISMDTGATLVGRALAQTAVTLDANAITPPTDVIDDTAAPTVSSTVPQNTATDVAINRGVTATFSEAMDPTTISTTTFTLKRGTTSISGTVTYSDLTATFKPNNDLATSTKYTATITTGAKDLAGNALESNYVWSFTTGDAPDTKAPTVSSTVPQNTATDVAINRGVTATFSEAMDPTTISTTTFTLKRGTTSISGTVTYSDLTATFKPNNDLATSTKYTATITTGAKDLAGNTLASNYVWSFTTGDASDTKAPTVSSTVPTNSATGVAINSVMTATFSEAMDPTTISTTTFTLKRGTTSISGTVTYTDLTATFKPNNDLAGSTKYTATITTGAKDLAGNALASNYVWSFTTSAVTDPSTVGTVVGRIVDANGDPIEGANVSVYGYEGIYAITNANGTYSLTGVPSGAQKLSVSAAGYQDQVHDVEVAPDATTTNQDVVIEPQDDGSKWAWPLFILAVLIVLAILGAVIYLRHKKLTEKDQEENN